ncbi:anti-sigma factor antagonist [bacterium]|nr:anti-sigma factor antagonist [bacterium]
MEIRVSHHRSIPVITLEGRFDGLAASEFDSRIPDLTHQSDTIILDFSRVAYLSSSGIRSLLKLKQHLGTRSGKTILVGVTSFAQQVLRTCGLLNQFPLAETVEEALAGQNRVSRLIRNEREYSIHEISTGKAKIESWQADKNAPPVAISLQDLGFAFGIAGFGSTAAQAVETMGPFVSGVNFAGVLPPEGISDFIVVEDPAEIFVYLKSAISMNGIAEIRIEIRCDKSFTLGELMKDLNELTPDSSVRAFIMFARTGALSGFFATGCALNAALPAELHAILLSEVPLQLPSENPQECVRMINSLVPLQEVCILNHETRILAGTVWIYTSDAIRPGVERLARIQMEDGSSMEEEWEKIIRRIYTDCNRIQLTPLHGGFVSKTFRVTSYDTAGRKQFPTVLKLGPAAVMNREENACRNYAEKFILNNSTTIMGTASHGKWAGLRYNFVGINGPDTKLTWFREHYSKRSLNELTPLYEKIFWKILDLWYGQSKQETLFLYQDHSPLRLFPGLFHDAEREFGISADSEFLSVPELNKTLVNPLHFLKYEYPARAEKSRSWYSAICHGDLNLQNVLLDEQENIYIIDFSETRVRNALADFARQETIVKFEMTRIDNEKDLQEILEFEKGIASVRSLTDPPPFHYSGHDPSVSKAHGVICLMRNYSRRAVHSQTDIIPYWLAVLEWTYSVLSYIGFPAIRKKYALYSAAIIVNRILELER